MVIVPSPSVVDDRQITRWDAVKGINGGGGGLKGEERRWKVQEVQNDILVSALLNSTSIFIAHPYRTKRKPP